MRSYRDGKELARQQMRGYVEKEYGAPYLHIHRGDFHEVLVDKAKELGVESEWPRAGHPAFAIVSPRSAGANAAVALGVGANNELTENGKKANHHARNPQ